MSLITDEYANYLAQAHTCAERSQINLRQSAYSMLARLGTGKYKTGKAAGERTTYNILIKVEYNRERCN